MRRRTTVASLALVAALVAMAWTALALAGFSAKDPWDDEGSNDIYVKHGFIKEVFTHHSGDKNFKFSYTYPIELWPGHWCLFLAEDQGGGVGTFPYPQCFEESKVSATVRAWARSKGLSLDAAERRAGIGFEATKKAGR